MPGGGEFELEVSVVVVLEGGGLELEVAVT